MRAEVAEERGYEERWVEAVEMGAKSPAAMSGQTKYLAQRYQHGRNFSLLNLQRRWHAV